MAIARLAFICELWVAVNQFKGSANFLSTIYKDFQSAFGLGYRVAKSVPLHYTAFMPRYVLDRVAKHGGMIDTQT